MDLDSNQLRFFADFIERNTGIVYSEANAFQLQHRLGDMAVQLGHRDVQELHAAAVRGGVQGQMKDLLLDLATNNETSFFRDPGLFDAYEKHLVPEVAKLLPSGAPLRVWSAASSTGQELYSLMMVAEESAAQAPASWPSIEYLATDFSERVLRRVEEGAYSQLEVQRGMPARLLIKYFDKGAKGDDRWTVKPLLRQRVKTRRVNLISDVFPSGPFGIVFCRNVLIYQSVDNKKKVIDKLADVLIDGGYLLLGAAESLLGLSDRFLQVQHGKAMTFRKVR